MSDGKELKQAALDLFEVHRPDYLSQAREKAIEIYHQRGDNPITVNDVREVLPPPDNIDGRVMGALLRAPMWVKVGMKASDRKECRRRPISLFVLAKDEAKYLARVGQSELL